MKESSESIETEYGNIDTCLNYFNKHNIGTDKSILDFGCNHGSFTNILWEKGYRNITGIDIDEESIEKGKKTYKNISDKLVLYSGDGLPFPDKCFDVIIAFDVLEHIPKLEEYLSSQIYRVLKHGGMVIFQTPNKITNIPWEIIRHKSFTEYKRDHCSLQTLNSLKNLLQCSGFNDIAIEKHDIITEFNKQKIKEKLGTPGILLLELTRFFPLYVTPNLWGHCKKPIYQ